MSALADEEPSVDTGDPGVVIMAIMLWAWADGACHEWYPVDYPLFHVFLRISCVNIQVAISSFVHF